MVTNSKSWRNLVGKNNTDIRKERNFNNNIFKSNSSCTQCVRNHTCEWFSDNTVAKSKHLWRNVQTE